MIGLALSFLSDRLARAAAWAFRNPAWAIAIAAAIVAWLSTMHAERWRAKDAKDRATIAQMQAASDAAAKAERDRNAQVEQANKDNADDKQRNYAAALADRDSRINAYVASCGMRPSACSRSAAPAAPQSDGPAVPERPATAPTVAFTAEQLKGWDDDYNMASQCRAFVLDLAKGTNTASPQP